MNLIICLPHIFALKLLQDYMINWRFKSLYCGRNLEFNIDINRKLRFGLVWKEEVNDHEDQQIYNNEALMKTQFPEDTIP